MLGGLKLQKSQFADPRSTRHVGHDFINDLHRIRFGGIHVLRTVWENPIWKCKNLKNCQVLYSKEAYSTSTQNSLLVDSLSKRSRSPHSTSLLHGFKGFQSLVELTSFARLVGLALVTRIFTSKFQGVEHPFKTSLNVVPRVQQIESPSKHVPSIILVVKIWHSKLLSVKVFESTR